MEQFLPAVSALCNTTRTIKFGRAHYGAAFKTNQEKRKEYLKNLFHFNPSKKKKKIYFLASDKITRHHFK